jgi:hypothetical protein
MSDRIDSGLRKPPTRDVKTKVELDGAVDGLAVVATGHGGLFVPKESARLQTAS